MKRIFLRLEVLLSGCILFMCISACGQVPSQPSPEKTVVVVGGGISGLIAALHLEKNGVDVILLEKESSVGGRVYSEDIGGVPANLGAQYFFVSDNDYLNHYVKCANKFIPMGGKTAALWDGHFASSWSERFFLELPIDRKALEDFEASMKKMQETYSCFMNGREYVFDTYPASEIWSDLDKVSAAEYLSEFHPDVQNIFNMFLIPEGGAGVDETSALLLTGWYGQEEKGASYLIKGGNQKLPQAIADDIEELGGEIHLSTTVSEVKNIDNGVEVQCKNGKIYNADYAIVTTPATITKWIVKDLSKEKIEALDAVKYGASMQVGLHLVNLPKKIRISSSIFHNENINAYMDQAPKSKADETVVSLNIAGKEVHKLTEKELIDYITIPLKKIYPDFSAEKNIAGYSIKKWRDGIVRYPPEFLSNYVIAIRESSGNIFFGGDYTHSPALDGAAWSGVRAANQVLNELK